MYMAPEHLLQRLASDDCSADDVEEFLWGQVEELERDYEGPGAPDIHLFFNGAQDLLEYQQAKHWWPRKDVIAELPGLLGCPSVFNLCYAYHENDPRIGSTFQERLRIAGNRVVEWLIAQGIDPAHPNESPKDRKARLARGAAAAVRGKGRGTPDNSTKALYDAYLQACARRKAAYDQLTPEVEQAHAAWRAAKG